MSNRKPPQYRYRPAQRFNIWRELVACAHSDDVKTVGRHLFDTCFDNPKDAAAYFDVDLATVYRWLKNGTWPAMALRLMLIESRGWLPTTPQWSGVRLIQVGTVRNQKSWGLSINGFNEPFLPHDVQCISIYKGAFKREQLALDQERLEKEATANRLKLVK
ncbi:hypothetical protein AHAT_18900 [Agarivorans sp. Toyoura001]|uniref:hypothetical protein n=1 Tax=Agarivorans sp. Toyoura001 TaxID=2283141 RepID=UPI0010F3C6F5|nr:hypothetical protein [Agarivorans sp. Toyoura001]GDY26000.1 hypothetical protein AHAT_18900 [Agarivorans sp. Toyoura001]